MSRKFDVGDKVRIVRSVKYHQCVGTVCTIRGGLKMRNDLASGKRVRCYQLDILCPGTEHFALVKPSQIVPYYDGDEPAKWADCVWRPSKISA